MKSSGIIIAVIVAGVLGLCAVISIFIGILYYAGRDSEDQNTGDYALVGEDSVDTVDKFFAADTKNGLLQYHKVSSDGSYFEDETGEFWVSGNDIRIDYYSLSGVKRISIISDSGVPYFCYDEVKSCEPSVASLEYYMSIFNKPIVSDYVTEFDSESSCTRYSYNVDTTYNMAGSTNAWYNKMLTYCTSDSSLVYIESVGAIPEVDGTISYEDTVRYTLTDIKVNLPVDQTVFDLTY